VHSIRTFAQLTGVTGKARRHDERAGLLAPKHPCTGYRRYFACLLFVLVPRALAAEVSVGDQAPRTAGDNRPRRLSVHVSAGAALPHGDESTGNIQSVSIGYAPAPKLMVLVNGGRTHSPTRVHYFSDGGFAATRGGTVLFVSGEVRFKLRSGRRASPYVMTGAGIGVSRPNVNEVFTDPITNTAHVLFSGGGLEVPVGPHLRVSADIGLFLIGERDAIRLILPLRGGLAWRF
jgi:hypothetical protein